VLLIAMLMLFSSRSNAISRESGSNATARATGGNAISRKSASTPAKMRRITFPNKYSAGMLYLNTDSEVDWAIGYNGRALIKAQGVCDIPDNGRVYLVASHAVLEHPEIFNAIPPDALACIKLDNLGALSNIDNITGPLGHLTGLRRLQLAGCELTDAGLTNLTGLHKLEGLSLGLCGIRGTCFKQWSLPHLRVLDLNDNSLAPEAYTYLSKYQTLKMLFVNQTGLKDDGLAEIAKLKNLTRLTLQTTRITGKGLKYLTRLKELRKLDLRGASLTVSDLSGLRGMNLEVLDLPSKYYSPHDLKTLKQIFPHTELPVTNGSVDTEMKGLFAPLR
jgi:hypothetical protein